MGNFKVNELRIGNYVNQVKYYNGNCNEIKVVSSINKDGYLNVISIDKKNINSININCFNPIQLTEEILLKCDLIPVYIKKQETRSEFLERVKKIEETNTFIDLEYSDTLDYFKTNCYIHFWVKVRAFNNRLFFIVSKENFDTNIKVIRYVHELQNIFFELTNKELNIQL
jgi:hypothetical protein